MFPQKLNLKKIEINSDMDVPSELNADIINNLIQKEYFIFILKFIISMMALIFGFILILKGIQSDGVISISLNEATLEFNKALPGVTIAVLALLLMLLSRLSIQIK